MTKKLVGSCIVGLSLVTLSLLVLPPQNKNDEKQSNNQEDIVSLRKQHSEHLANSPFKETIKLTKKERKAKGLPPKQYFEQMWELTINPRTGKTSPENIQNLQKELRSKRGNAKSAPGDSQSNPWVERGPNDIGGRTRAILFDPNDSNNRRVYAGGVSGGLWINNNITSSTSQWSRVQNVPGNLSVTSLTVDPRNSNIWYMGTGEQYTAGDVVGNGVYRSVDGGSSWQALTIPAAGGGNINFNANNLFISGIYYVNDIVAWNNTAQNRTELFVGVGAHAYGDASGPANWLGFQTAGLYRSIDGGSTWNRIESANMRFDFNGVDYSYIPNDFEIGADNTLWMGTITTPGIGGNGGGRVFNSTNGATWTQVTVLADANRVELETSTTNANKIYALTQGVTDPLHIYRTTDRFVNVTATALPNDADAGIPDNDFTRGQSFYDLMIEADPTNDNIVYVGGIDLFRSTNSGNSWSQISKWSNNSGLASLPVSFVHADQHAMTFRPGNSNQAIFGNDGGIFYASSLSNASNSNVFGARNNNYNVTQYVKAGIGPNGTGDVVGIFSAGAQDNGSQAFRNASAGINGSEELSDGDGFYTFVDKDGQYMTATFTNNNIYRFNLPWDGRGRRQGGATTLLRENTGDFVNQMGYDSDRNYLLSNASSGSNFAIKTIDVANNRNANITNALLTSKPTAFIASPFANATWYVGTATGGLLRLTGVGVGSANWTEITTPFVGSVSSVRLGATANDIMVTIHNYGVTSVWFTSNGGTSWASKEGDLPDIPVRDILQNPLDRTEVILATQLGVWVTKNFNATNPNWSQAYNGMSDASVTSFDYWAINGNDNNNKIIASTYGRGVFTGSFTSNTVADTQAPSVPTNLTASNTTQTTVDLNWSASTDNVGVTEYEVLQDGAVVGSVTATNTTVSGLTANTSYTFRVRATDAAGNTSGNSNSVAVTTASGGGGGTSGCTAGISSFPYNEGFESGLGGWTQGSGDDFDWTRQSGGTPSNNTGPSSADQGSFYVYVETSNPNNPSRTTILNSPCFNLTGETAASFAFRYQMTGNAVGELKLEASSNNGVSWTQVWSRSGDQGAPWNSATVDLTSYTSGSVQLRFVGTSGSSWQGDMAVDAISLTTGGTDPGNGGGVTGCTGGISSFPYNEGFESGLGNWTQGSGDDFDWTRQSGGTPSRSTGPSSAVQGSFYVYVETSNPNNPNRTTILNSPCFNLSSASSASFTFRYHMTGNAVGELKLEASNDNGGTWAQVWSRSGNQGGNWNSSSVNLDSYTGNSVQLRFVGTSGTSWQGDMAVDNIALTTSNSASVDNLISGTEGIDNKSFGFKLYPNPVTGNTLYFTTQASSTITYKIMNMVGQVIDNGTTNDGSINIQDLSRGTYLMEMTTDNLEKSVKAFVRN